MRKFSIFLLWIKSFSHNKSTYKNEGYEDKTYEGFERFMSYKILIVFHTTEDVEKENILQNGELNDTVL